MQRSQFISLHLYKENMINDELHIVFGRYDIPKSLKGIDYCPIKIIKGLTDKGQFQ